jgi:hypothetical protein
VALMCDPGPVAPTSGDDQPLPLRELVRRAGVSDGTLRNWARLRDRPLRTERAGPRTVFSTVAELRGFCAAHSELRATKAVLARLDSPAIELDPATLRGLLEAVLTAVRAATAAHLELAQTSLEHTETAVVTCRTHAAALTSALHGLDNALIRFAPPPRDSV